MARALAERGWKVAVLTLAPEHVQPIDAGVQDPEGVEVIRTTMHEPATALRRLFSNSTSTPPGRSIGADSTPPRTSLLRRVGKSLLDRLEFPDPTAGWIPVATRAVAGRSFDVVLATTPPFSSAVAGRKIAESLGSKLVLDYRDPWLESPGIVASKAMPSSLREKHRRWEDRCLSRADLVLAVSRTIGRWLELRSPRPVAFYPNGFEPHASRDGSPVRSLGDLVYVGSLSYGRDLAPLLRALARSGDGNAQGPTLVYAGPHGDALQASARASGAAEHVVCLEGVPHAEAMALLRGARAGIVVVASGYEYSLPGKLYDVMAAGKPVLLLGPPEGEAADMVNRHRLGWAVDPRDQAGMEAAIAEIRSGRVADPVGLDQYDARVLADELDRTLRALLSG